MTVASTTSGRKALELFIADVPDLVVADIHMLHMNGFQLLRAIKRIIPRFPVILYTSWGSMKQFFKEKVAPADGFLDAPFTATDLRNAILNAAEQANSTEVSSRLRCVCSLHSI